MSNLRCCSRIPAIRLFPVIPLLSWRVPTRAEARLISPAQNNNPVQHGPPYELTTAVVGGVPTVATDVPVAAVLLALFLASAAAHMTILQLNKRAGLKFLFSGMMFALGVLRSVALGMRMVWAAYPRSANVAVAAGILTQTGSVLPVIVNLIFAQRVVRAYHPTFGWHRATTLAFRFLIGCVVACLVMAVAVTTQTFLTLEPAIRRSDRLVQLFAGTYMAVLAFLPLPFVVLAAWLPRRGHVEKFGAGRWRTKVRLLLLTSALAALGAAFRVYTGYATRPVHDPAWYHGRACYYCFNFVVDLTISAAFLLSRFDRRFIVPDGAKGPGDYAKGMRVRPSSIVSSSRGRDEDLKEGDLEKSSDGSTGSGSEMASLPMYADKIDGKGKGKEREVGVESGEKQTASPTPAPVTTCDAQTQTYGPPGDWNTVPWPFRTSWDAVTRSFDRAPPSTDHPSTGGSSTDLGPPVNYSPVDGPFQAFSSIDELSSQWGGETRSSTCIQESQSSPAHQTTPRRFHRHQLQHEPEPASVVVFGQALTVDEEIYLDAPRPPADGTTFAWPFVNTTHDTPGRDLIATSSPRRHNSTTTHDRQAGSNQKTAWDGIGVGVGVGRSWNCRTPADEPAEGGWI